MSWSATLLASALWAAPVAAGDSPGERLAAGRVRAALAACDEKLAADPQDAATIELAAHCLHALGRDDEALARLSALSAPAAEAQLLRVRCLLARDESVDAAAQAFEALALPPEDPRRAPLRVRLLLARGRVGDAVREAGKLAARAADDGEALLLQGLALQAAGRGEEAETTFAALEQRARPSALEWRRAAWSARVDGLLKARRWMEAASAAATLSTLTDAAEPCAQQAMALGFARQYAAAIAAWEEAVRRAPEQREHRLRLADLLRSQGRLADAQAHYQTLAEATPPVALAVLRLAELAFESGEPETAFAQAERAATLAPDSGDVAAIRGRVAEKRGERTRAIELLRAALVASPLRFDVLYRLALLLARSRDAGEAAEGEALLARYRRLEPWLQEIDLARQEANADPRQPLLLVRLGALLNAGGEHVLAKGFLLRAERLAPPAPATLVQVGYVLANLGETAAARDRFARALPQIEAHGEASAAEKLRGWIATIDRGERLPLPLGEILTPGDARDD